MSLWEDYSYPYNQQSSDTNCSQVSNKQTEDNLIKNHSQNILNGNSKNETKLDTKHDETTLPYHNEPDRSPNAKRLRCLNEDDPTISYNIPPYLENSLKNFAGDNSNDGTKHGNIAHNDQEQTLPYHKPFRSPIAKRFRSLSDDTTLGYDYSDIDSDSFHYTQWAKEQANKSKDLQKYFNVDNDSKKGINCSEYTARQEIKNLDEDNNEFEDRLPCEKKGKDTVDCVHNRQSWNQSKDARSQSHYQETCESVNSLLSQDKDMCKHVENLQHRQESDIVNSESEFHFTEWANQQKEKCKFVHYNTNFDTQGSTIESKEQNEQENLLEVNTLADSNFRFTEWVTEQKSKTVDAQKPNRNLKCGMMDSKYNTREALSESQIISIPETQFCIPESQVFDFENKSQRNDTNSESSHRKTNMQGKVWNMRISSKNALNDVSNIYPKDEKHAKFDFKNNIVERRESKNAISSLDSEPFQYTEWIQDQKTISKEIQKQSEKFKLKTDDEFWEKPIGRNDKVSKKESTKKEMKTAVLASDTDQDSDTEESIFSL